jgi:hypothetical protein
MHRTSLRYLKQLLPLLIVKLSRKLYQVVKDNFRRGTPVQRHLRRYLPKLDAMAAAYIRRCMFIQVARAASNNS